MLRSSDRRRDAGALSVSLAVHGVLALALLARPPRAVPAATEVVPFMLSPPAPGREARVEGARPAPSRTRVLRRRSTRLARTTITAQPVITASETGDEASSGSPGGEGLGESGAGHASRTRRPELAGRVVGDGRFAGSAGGPRGLAYVSLAEATALRSYDFFPRLPAALWQGDHPYVVVVDVCVSEDGQVSEAALLVHRSAALDPMVLAAVRTWRYRPRLVGGRPGSFCHVVTIRYEPA